MEPQASLHDLTSKSLHLTCNTAFLRLLEKREYGLYYWLHLEEKRREDLTVKPSPHRWEEKEGADTGAVHFGSTHRLPKRGKPAHTTEHQLSREMIVF